MNCSCRKGEAHRGKEMTAEQWEEWRSTREKDLKDLLKEVSLSGVEHDDERLDYVTVQIDRTLWEAIRKELEE